MADKSSSINIKINVTDKVNLSNLKRQFATASNHLTKMATQTKNVLDKFNAFGNPKKDMSAYFKLSGNEEQQLRAFVKQLDLYKEKLHDIRDSDSLDSVSDEYDNLEKEGEELVQSTEDIIPVLKKLAEAGESLGMVRGIQGLMRDIDNLGLKSSYAYKSILNIPKALNALGVTSIGGLSSVSTGLQSTSITTPASPALGSDEIITPLISDDFSTKMTAGQKAMEAFSSSFRQNFGSSFQSAISKTKAQFKALANNLKNIVSKQMQQSTKVISGFRSSAVKLMDSLRQITQGFLSMGRAITFFVSVPLTAFLKSAIETAVDFEAQLARIAKVAGETSSLSESIFGGKTKISSDFSDSILELSLVALSTPQQFASWAEQLAQLGVKSKEAVLNMLPMFDLLASATDIPAEEIASSFGKIATSFGNSFRENAEVASEFVWKMANVINVLENNVGTTAGAIVDGLAEVGPMVNMLGIDPTVVATWVALGTEAGLSSNVVGTSLKRTFTYFASASNELEKYAIANESVNARKREMIALGELAEGQEISYNDALIATIEGYGKMISIQGDEGAAIAEMSDFVKRSGITMVSALAMEMVGVDGLSEAYQDLSDTVRREVDEVSRGNASLISEYEIMANTTQGALARIKNSFEYIKIAGGDAFLPAIANAIDDLIPMIRALMIEFGNLSDKVKGIVGKVILFIAVLGPVSFFLNQIAFGVTLVALGLTKLVTFAGSAIGAVFSFGKALLTLNPIAWAAFIGIASVMGSVKDVTIGTLGDIASVIKDMISNATGWGKNLFGSFADGINQSSGLIIDAVQNIVKIISGFIRSFSPPKKGELRHIDKWGKNLFDTYLHGMEDADFDILNDIGSTMEHVLTTFEFMGDIEEPEIASRMMDYREKLAQLMSEFNSTGSVSEAMIQSTVAGLGEESDEIATIIREYMKLKDIMLDIQELNDKRDKIQADFRTGVRAIASEENGTVKDRYAALDKLQRLRDNQLFYTEEELEIAEKKEELQQEELDRIDDITNAQIDQDNYEMSMWKALEEAASGAGDSISDAMTSALDDMTTGLSGFGNVFESKLAELRVKVADFRAFVAGTWKALFEDLGSWDIAEALGAEMDDDAKKELSDAIRVLYEDGQLSAQAAILKVASLLGKEAAEEFAASYNLPTPEDLFPEDSTSSKAASLGEEIKKAWEGIQGLFETAETSVTDFFDAISAGYDSIEKTDKTGLFDNDSITDFTALGETLGKLAGLLVEHGPTIIDNLLEIGQTIGQIFNSKVETNEEGFVGLAEWLLKFLSEETGKLAEMDTTELETAIGEFLTKILVGAVALISFKTIASALITNLVTSIAAGIAGIGGASGLINIVGKLIAGGGTQTVWAGVGAEASAGAAGAAGGAGIGGITLPIAVTAIPALLTASFKTLLEDAMINDGNLASVWAGNTGGWYAGGDPFGYSVEVPVNVVPEYVTTPTEVGQGSDPQSFAEKMFGPNGFSVPVSPTINTESFSTALDSVDWLASGITAGADITTGILNSMPSEWLSSPVNEEFTIINTNLLEYLADWYTNFSGLVEKATEFGSALSLTLSEADLYITDTFIPTIEDLITELAKAIKMQDKLGFAVMPTEAHQTGGSVRQGVPSIVGESGRELFIPDSAGTIVPHARLISAFGSGGNGGGNNYTFSLQSLGNTDITEQSLERLANRMNLLYGGS